jgi:hypothetical protein
VRDPIKKQRVFTSYDKPVIRMRLEVYREPQVNAHSILVSSYLADVNNVTDLSELHVSSIFRIKNESYNILLQIPTSKVPNKAKPTQRTSDSLP